MLRIRRTKKVLPPLSHMEKRAAHLQTHELIPWAEQCLYIAGRSLMDYGREPVESFHLQEAERAGQTLMVLLAELKSRTLTVNPVSSRGAASV